MYNAIYINTNYKYSGDSDLRKGKFRKFLSWIGGKFQTLNAGHEKNRRSVVFKFFSGTFKSFSEEGRRVREDG